jgi:hypothetical protein
VSRSAELALEVNGVPLAQATAHQDEATGFLTGGLREPYAFAGRDRRGPLEPLSNQPRRARVHRPMGVRLTLNLWCAAFRPRLGTAERQSSLQRPLCHSHRRHSSSGFRQQEGVRTAIHDYLRGA